MTHATHTVPNVFIEYECSRNAVPQAQIPTSILETYAQNNEDIIVDALLRGALAPTGRDMSTVYYVEIGANHPIQTSNTYLFYRKYGASGILVEANSDLTAQLRRTRPRDQVIEVAVSARSDATLTFSVCGLSELSSLERAHVESFRTQAPITEVTVRNLHINALLETCVQRPIDFLSIDVEGVDMEILEALDFTRFRPLVMQCEPSEHFRPGMSARMIALLESRGYTLIARTDINLIFRSGAIANLQ